MPLGHTLVIRPGALGDAILTLPALHALRLAGAASLTVLGSPASWGFIRTAHDGLRIRDFSSSDWLALFSEGLPLSPAAHSALARTETAIVYLAGDTSSVERALRSAGVRKIVCAVPPLAGSTSIAHASQQLLNPLQEIPGVEDFFERALQAGALADDVFLAIDEPEIVRALGNLGCDAPPDNGFVGIHPGSGGRAKCWPARSFARLLANLSMRGMTPLVFFGPADDAIREDFETSVAPGLHWECAAGRPLREVLALLTCCQSFVGNDSGLTHLAARACPTTALFGPTNPRVWSPLGENVDVLVAPDGDLSRLSVDEVADRLCSC